MKPLGTHNYWVYITTNLQRTVLYIGMTNNLDRRLWEHEDDAKNAKRTFAGKYKCFNLVYMEWHLYVNDAIRREKELKGWTRARKDALIKEENPEWRFLNNLG